MILFGILGFFILLFLYFFLLVLMIHHKKKIVDIIFVIITGIVGFLGIISAALALNPFNFGW